MNKWKKSERIIALVKHFVDQPNHSFQLNEFSDQYGASKSSISEDIRLIKDYVTKAQIGELVSEMGSKGGVFFRPRMQRKQMETFLQHFSEKIMEEEHVLPGGFVSLTEQIYHPSIARKIALVFTSLLDYSQAEYVVTMETKGIPMATMTAHMMNLPLLIIRKNMKISEGPTLSINYESGPTGMVQSMSLTRRSLAEGSRVILIDDFLRGGGTLKGMYHLMVEFNTRVVGAGVLIATKTPLKKRYQDYIALLEMDQTEEGIIIAPNCFFEKND